MPTEPEPLTVAGAVQRAAEVSDPSGVDADIGDFVLYLEDADEPITAVADLSDRLEEARRSVDPEGDLPGVTMTAAVANYLAYRRDELDDRPGPPAPGRARGVRGGSAAGRGGRVAGRPGRRGLSARPTRSRPDPAVRRLRSQGRRDHMSRQAPFTDFTTS